MSVGRRCSFRQESVNLATYHFPSHSRDFVSHPNAPVQRAARQLRPLQPAVICSEANHRIHGSVFFDPFGITIGHKIQSDVMFKERF